MPAEKNIAMFCPKCKSDSFSKDGTVNGRSRYSCPVCGFDVVIPISLTSIPDENTLNALIMYLSGASTQEIFEQTGLHSTEIVGFLTRAR